MKKIFIDKPFEELTLEEFRLMMRNPKGIMYDLDEFLKLYGISIEKYTDYVRETKGIALKSEERRALTKWKDNKRKKEPEKMEYTGAEIKGFRMLRGYNTERLGREIIIFPEDLRKFERRKRVPNWVARRYISHLGITHSEIERLRLYLARKTKGFEAERKIPDFIKEKVRKRDKNKCVKCQSPNKLHFHHKEHFAKGGLHVEENIVLLCASCHADVHKDDQSYWLLKKIAEEE